MEIKETIVVEGKNDVVRLNSFIKANYIITNGTHISKKTLALIEAAQTQTGVIIFTDPDYPGSYIRQKINEAVPNCKNAFINAKKARKKALVGVEHASKTDILNALGNLVSYQTKADTIDYQQLRTLGLIGSTESTKIRERLSETLNIGYCNGKTFLKRLNMLDIDYETISMIIQGATNE